MLLMHRTAWTGAFGYIAVMTQNLETFWIATSNELVPEICSTLSGLCFWVYMVESKEKNLAFTAALAFGHAFRIMR